MNNILKKVKRLNNRKPKSRFFVQYRGNITQNFASRLKKLCDIQIIFTTRKLKTCLPTLKSHVVNKITCNECSSTYVGQTSCHVTTKISKHQKQDSPVGQHLIECCGTTPYVKWGFLIQVAGLKK